MDIRGEKSKKSIDQIDLTHSYDKTPYSERKL